MKKKLLTLLLTVCLLAGLSAPALADMDAFVPVRAYDGHFTDVTRADWYYDSVVSLYELGLAEGQSLSSFGSRSSISLAEVVTFAARIHSAYYLGSPSLGPALYAGYGGEWFRPYVSYLRDAGLIDGRFEDSWRRAATRAETAGILCYVLPEDELDSLNSDTVHDAYLSGEYITDVDINTPYATEILALYFAGIATGSDSRGSFKPYTEITRAELAAMLTRIVYPEKRVILDWSVSGPEPVRPTEPEPEPVQPTQPAEPSPSLSSSVSYPDLVFEQGHYIPSHSIDDEQAILSNIRWLFRNGQTELKLSLDPSATRPIALNQLLDNYITTSMLYLEQGYTAVGCQYDNRGNMTLSFSNPNGGDRDAALKKAIEIRDRFHADGTITEGMTDVEIARVYARYLCRTCNYDYSTARVSHTAYGALIDGSAVCEGYTAAYNIFLKLEGINASTVQTTSHIWTTAQLDGILYHIDVTWCDQDYGFEDRFFCMTPEFAVNRDVY